MKYLIFFSFIILISGMAYSSTYLDYLTYSIADSRYCILNASCYLQSLTVQNMTVINITVTNINLTNVYGLETKYLYVNTSNAPQLATFKNLSITNKTVIEYIGDAGSSTSVGGALLIDNTDNIGSGMTIYSNKDATASGDLLNIRSNNDAFDRSLVQFDYRGSSNAIVGNYRTNDSSGIFLTLTSYNELDTLMGLTGYTQARAVGKFVHIKPAGSDAGASTLSIVTQGAGTGAHNLFIDAENGTTGNLILARNQGADKFTVSSDGNISLSGNVFLPLTNDSEIGVIYKGTSRFLHDYHNASNQGQNVFIGNGSGNFNMGGANSWDASQNVGVGWNTLSALTTGFYDLGIGSGALSHITSGSGNMGMGYLALAWCDTCSNNAAIGANSLAYLTASASSNVGIGQSAGAGSYGNSHNIHSNTLVGAYSGQTIRNGSNANTMIGYKAGNKLANGYNNIIIGYAIELPTNSTNNTVSIANLIYATNISSRGQYDASTSNVSSGNVGIGTSFPAYKLDVNGTIRAVNSIISDENITALLFKGDWNGSANKMNIDGSNSADLVNFSGNISMLRGTLIGWDEKTEYIKRCSNADCFAIGAQSTDGLTVYNNKVISTGNFSINDETPDAKIEINNYGGGNAFMISSSSGGDGDLLLVGSDGKTRILSTGSYQMQIGYNSSTYSLYSVDNTGKLTFSTTGGTNNGIVFAAGTGGGFNLVANGAASGSNLAFVTGALRPFSSDDNLIDLGISTARWNDINAGGNVVIGGVTASAKLTVNQTADNTGIKLHGYDDMQNNFTHMYVDSSGYSNIYSSNLFYFLSNKSGMYFCDGVKVACLRLFTGDGGYVGFSASTDHPVAFYSNKHSVFTIDANKNELDAYTAFTKDGEIDVTGNLSQLLMVVRESGRLGVGTFYPEYPLHINNTDSTGTSAYGKGNASFSDYLYHSPFTTSTKEEALDDILKIRGNNGKIDHATLPIEAKSTLEFKIYNTTYEEKIVFKESCNETECRNISTIELIPTDKVIGHTYENQTSMGILISKLILSTQKLSEENDLMKNELCLMGRTRFC